MPVRKRRVAADEYEGDDGEDLGGGGLFLAYCVCIGNRMVLIWGARGIIKVAFELDF